MDRNWSPTTKRWVVIFSVIAIFLVLRRIGSILPPIIITFILAYILKPIADFVSARLRLKRSLGSHSQEQVLNLLLARSQDQAGLVCVNF